MLVRLITAIVIFFVVRFFASLYITRASVYNGIAAGAFAIFVLALWGHGAWYRSHVPGTAAQATAPAGEATKATPIILSRADVRRLTATAGNPSLGAIDAVTMSPTGNDAPPGNIVRSGSSIFVRGWAASAAKAPFQALIVVIDHRINIDGTAHYGGLRPDVAKAYNAANMSYTGFSAVAVPTSGLRNGSHTLQLGGLSDDGRHYVLVPVVANFSVQ